jgi:DNA-binding MarR family transcriptional regulator
VSGAVNQDDRLVLEQQVCFSLAVASREVISLYRPLLEPLGLTHPQYLVMLTLWQVGDPVSVKTLSERLKLEPPTLSPLLKRLQTAGLIERHRDPSDERSLRITLTQRGHELREDAVAVPPAIMERLGMGIDELVSLRDVLMGVIDHANAGSGRRRV